MFGRNAAALLLGLGVILTSLAAEAAPSPKERSQASTAWTAGKRLHAQRKMDEAIESFRRANELDPKAQYQLDLARALAQNKGLVEARDLCDTIEGSKEPNSQRAKLAARALKKEIEPRIPSIKVEVSGKESQSAMVTINGETVQAGKDLPYDPGPYTVKGRVGQNPEVTEQVELAESQHRTVSIDLGKAEIAKVEKPESSGGGGNMAPAAVTYAIGGAALIAGGVMGGLAFDQTSKTEALCGGSTCAPEFADDVALAQDYGTASTVLFAVGGLGVAAGIILTFTVGLDSGEGGGTDEKAAYVTPFVGVNQVGVRGQF